MAECSCVMDDDKENNAPELEEQFEGSDSEESVESMDETSARVEDPTTQNQEENAKTSRFVDKEPLELVPYVENYVTVELEKDYAIAGFVHSIDPNTRSIILSVPKEDETYRTILIPGLAIVKVTLTDCDRFKPPVLKETEGIFSAEVQLRKRKIISWLKENHLATREEGENVHFGGAILLPPYGRKDICTTNAVAALEIKKLIARMPADYVPK